MTDRQATVWHRLVPMAALLAAVGAAIGWWRLGGHVSQPTGGPAPHAVVAESAAVADAAVADFSLVDLADSVGLRFEYFRGDTGRLWTLEPHGGGASWLDFDADGRQDLFLVNGTQLPPDAADFSHISQLFRNRGDDGFESVTMEAGLRINHYGQGCSSGDYDNDGFPDLLVTAWRQCVLLRNNGDGTWGDVTVEAGIAPGDWNTGACFADFDRDGNLDLYIANYLKFDPNRHAACLTKDLLIGYCGPHHYEALDDFLYRNVGDGRFQDVSEDAGIRQPNGPGFGGVAADVDNDGWPDLLVANDAFPNFLFRNLGATLPPNTIGMKDVALEWGIGVNADGLAEANMGIACGDYDANGFLDFGISHFYQEHFTLFQNLGSTGFMDKTQLAGLDYTTRSKMGWGTGFLDIDADGWLDLFIVNGHINNHKQTGMPYEMAAQLFRNDEGHRFADVSDRSGVYFRKPYIARGTAVGDFDEDGRVDIAIVHHHAPMALLANRTPVSNHVLVLRFVGVASSRDGTNVRAVVTLEGAADDGGDRVLLRECVAGEGYLGSNDKRLWFGLGDRAEIDKLEVHWPSGRVDTFNDIAADQQCTLIEGRTLESLRQYR